ncbi:hypothetical protein GGG16DRAFT_114757 [Schizophyllum commune]
MAVDQLTGPTLPQELLDLVLDHLGAWIDYKSLQSCSLAHRCLLARSQQWLFREIRLIVNEYDLEDVDQRERSQPERLYAILQESPHLAEIALHGLAQEKVLPLLLTQLPGLAKLELIVSTDGRIPELGEALVDALAATSIVDLGIHNGLAFLLSFVRELDMAQLGYASRASDTRRAPRIRVAQLEYASRSSNTRRAARIRVAQLGYASRTMDDKLFLTSDRLQRLTTSFPRACVLFYRLDISSLGSLRDIGSLRSLRGLNIIAAASSASSRPRIDRRRAGHGCGGPSR